MSLHLFSRVLPLLVLQPLFERTATVCVEINSASKNVLQVGLIGFGLRSLRAPSVSSGISPLRSRFCLSTPSRWASNKEELTPSGTTAL